MSKYLRKDGKLNLHTSERYKKKWNIEKTNCVITKKPFGLIDKIIFKLL